MSVYLAFMFVNAFRWILLMHWLSFWCVSFDFIVFVAFPFDWLLPAFWRAQTSFVHLLVSFANFRHLLGNWTDPKRAPFLVTRSRSYIDMGIGLTDTSAPRQFGPNADTVRKASLDSPGAQTFWHQCQSVQLLRLWRNIAETVQSLKILCNSRIASNAAACIACNA